MKGLQAYKFQLWKFHKFPKIFMIRFQKFRWKTEFPFTKLRNVQSWNLQLKSPLQTNVDKPILYSGLYAYPHHHPCTPCENASDRRQGNFPHSAYYPPFRSNFPHIPFRILPSAFRNSAFYQQPTVDTCWQTGNAANDTDSAPKTARKTNITIACMLKDDNHQHAKIRRQIYF